MTNYFPKGTYNNLYINAYLIFRNWNQIFKSYYNNYGIQCCRKSRSQKTYGTIIPKLFNFLQPLLNLSYGNIVLDVGFGHGLLLYYLALFNNCKCIGVENDSARYAEALSIKKLFIALCNPYSELQMRNTILLLVQCLSLLLR